MADKNPSILCGECKKAVAPAVRAICAICKTTYHVGKECAGVYPSTWNAKTEKSKETWSCGKDDCKPVTAPASTTAPSLPLPLAGNKTYSNNDIMAYLHQMTIHTDKKMEELKTSVEFMSSKYDEVIERVGNLEKSQIEQEKTFTNLQEENNFLHKVCVSQQQEIHDLQQYTRNRNIEISGIDLRENENLPLILKNLAEKLSLPPDFDVMHRLSPPNRSNAPPKIIVQFLSRTARDKWTQHRNTGIKSAEVVPGGSDSTIYISENLSPFLRDLFFKARKAANRLNYKYCWIKNGKIFMKKADNSRSVKLIRTEEDLNALNIASEETLVKSLTDE